MITNLKRRVWDRKKEKREWILAERRGRPLYGRYYFTGTERILYPGISLAVVCFCAFFFYRNLYFSLFLIPLGMAVYENFRKGKGEKRRQKLEEEFRDCVLSVAANLRAGYSVENAFMECGADMVSLYGREGLMIKELRLIQKGLLNNVPLEQLLQDLGERSGSESIREFGEVFAIARSSGGSLPDVLQSTAELIGEEIGLKQEVQVTISGKLFEQKIMNVIPFLLVAYIEVTNRGFFDVLYHNLTGVVIMTGCLGIYLTAILLERKIIWAIS